jgi:hypothetical protein
VRDQIDDLFVGEVTKPETLAGLCDGIEVVFSSVGLTRQKDKLTFHDVDYQGNKNILDLALEASVERFIYVSVYNARLMEHLAIIKAHDDFARFAGFGSVAHDHPAHRLLFRHGRVPSDGEIGAGANVRLST